MSAAKAAAAAEAKAAWTEWLGASVDGFGLKADVANMLCEAAMEEELDVTEYPADGTKLGPVQLSEGEKDLMALVKSAYREAGITPVPEIAERRIKKWYGLRFKEVGMDGANDGTAAVEKIKTMTLTPQMERVLLDNGMPNMLEHAGLELSLTLGRAVAREECAGFLFGAPPSNMQGLVQMKKSKIDTPTIDVVLEGCGTAGSLASFDAFVQRAVTQMGQSDLMAESRSNAVRILNFLHNAQGNCPDEEERIEYFRLWRTTYSMATRRQDHRLHVKWQGVRTSGGWGRPQYAPEGLRGRVGST
jgi:hypothetical protein